MQSDKGAGMRYVRVVVAAAVAVLALLSGAGEARAERDGRTRWLVRQDVSLPLDVDGRWVVVEGAPSATDREMYDVKVRTGDGTLLAPVSLYTGGQATRAFRVEGARLAGGPAAVGVEVFYRNYPAQMSCLVAVGGCLAFAPTAFRDDNTLTVRLTSGGQSQSVTVPLVGQLAGWND